MLQIVIYRGLLALVFVFTRCHARASAFAAEQSLALYHFWKALSQVCLAKDLVPFVYSI